MAAAEKQSYPKTLWSSTPRIQTRIRIWDPLDKSRLIGKLRFRDGMVIVNNEHEEALVRRVMKDQVWPTDLDEPEIDEQGRWVCYSSKAFSAYLKAQRRHPHTDPLKRM